MIHSPLYRPIPEAFVPPNGTCGSLLIGWSLTWTIPASIRSATSRAREIRSECTDAASPYSVSFASSTASSSSLNGTTGATGPKCSLHAAAISFLISESTVGSTNRPSASPPSSSVAPCSTDCSMYARMSSRSASLIIGPTIVSSSRGSPTASSAARSTSRSTYSSRISSWTRWRLIEMQICP